mgnify:CR=1 FL=1
MKMSMLKEKHNKFWTDFKAFMLRGNVLDLAVGVIIGGAFNAIVTSLVNILLSVCTWAVPGGLKGLVTVLPAVNETQAGMDVANGLGQQFAAGSLHTLAEAEAYELYGETVVTQNPNLIESVKTTILSKYTLHGTTYFYNGSAIIDWGAFINAIIAFLIIGTTLFIIVRVVRAAEARTREIKEKALAELKAKTEGEQEEAPAPEKPAVPAKPADVDVLLEIRDELKKLNEKEPKKAKPKPKAKVKPKAQ